MWHSCRGLGTLFYLFVFKLDPNLGLKTRIPWQMHLTPLPPSHPITLPSYPKFLNYAGFEPLVVGIQKDLICPPLLPINLDEDRRVGTSFLQVSRLDPQGPWEFCRDRSSCIINSKKWKDFHASSGENEHIKGDQDWNAGCVQLCLTLPLYNSKYQIWEMKDSLLFESVCLNVSFFKVNYFILIGRLKLYNTVVVFAIHQHESAIGIHVPPSSWTPFCMSLPTPSLWLVPEQQIWVPCFEYWTRTGHLFHI